MKQSHALACLLGVMRKVVTRPFVYRQLQQQPLAKIGALLVASLYLPAPALAAVSCDMTDSSFCMYFGSTYSTSCPSGTTVSACSTANLLGTCTNTYTSSSYSSTTITFWYARNGTTTDSASYFSQSCTSSGDIWSSGSTSQPSGPTATTVLPAPPASQSAYSAPNGQLPEAAVQIQASGTYGNARLSVTVNVAAALGSSIPQSSGVAYSCNVPSSHFCQDYYVGTYTPTVCGTNSIIETSTSACSTANKIGTCTSADFFTTHFYSGYPVSVAQDACALQPAGVWSEGAGSTRSNRAAGAYNVYVIAMLPGSVAGSASPVLYVKPRAPAFWQPLQWPMAEFMSNVVQSAVNDQVLVEILDNTNLLGLIGAEIYIGYGTSDQEMLAANRFRGVYKVQ